MHSFCSACLAGERAAEGASRTECPVCGLEAAYAVNGIEVSIYPGVSRLCKSLSIHRLQPGNITQQHHTRTSHRNNRKRFDCSCHSGHGQKANGAVRRVCNTHGSSVVPQVPGGSVQQLP